LAHSVLVERVPWEKVQEGWTFFKVEVLKAQKQAVPMCRKTKVGKMTSLAEQGGFSGTPGKNENLRLLEEGAGDSRRVQ